MMSGQPFQIHFDNALRKDLQCRLAHTRWRDAVTSDWRYGMQTPFLKTLIEYWQTTYSFDAAEHRMNAMTQFRATVGGFGVHYVLSRGQGPRPKPLLLMNGWPSNFGEYCRLAPMLADPAAFGVSAEDAFDVVMPALLGFGFSDRPTSPNQVNAEDLFNTLMTDISAIRLISLREPT